MSTGESDYAKRVVELSMQLANSRADVENLRMRIKAVDKEHEQLKKDRADMVDRFDAALRAAKMEGVASVRHIIQNRLIDLRLSRSTCRLSFAIDEYDAQIEALESIMRQAGEPFSRHNEKGIDARAAQIEEGE